ncbi:bis-aminopropyl spermidine synthase family protein [Calderihabitans maritimus]|uniref:N(4)-bis(aminopropyl)spermidine synthase n=1 Tax=Calderihabitans maritimus TaxID=1246530 RepID=A0A1Z5HUZ9_9FIRM|nr:bis-aminopropyl spermidine synthase family protein [Calderihabitans maritimus]GAW93177.1 hypothetical protein Desku_2563 [Calderihabitans maritimus]
MERTRMQIIRSLLAGEKSFWELIRDQDGDLSSYCQEIGQLIEEGIIEADDQKITLTEKGQEWAGRNRIKPLQDIICSRCEGKGLVLQGIFQEVLEQFRQLTKDRPPAIAEFDQGFVEPENTVARVAFMYARGDLENKNIFILGDDDLTTIAAALTQMPRRIVVAEIDERIVEFITTVVERQGWKNVQVVKYDVRNPLPEELQGQFDVFVTDPVETIPGLKLFLSRCIQALKGKSSAGYFGLTHLEASRKKWYAIQQMILDMNFVITDLVHDFHRYILEREKFVTKNYPVVEKAPVPLPVPQVNWYTSNLFRLEAVGVPQPATDKKSSLGRELYFDNESYATLP